MSLLQDARTAFEAEDLPAAIRLLVRFWRGCPAPELGDLVADLDARAYPQKIRDEAAWNRAAHRPHLDTLGVLARSLIVRPRSEAEARIHTALAWPPDPRVGAVLASLLSPVKWTASSSRPTWNQIFALLVSCGDPRFLEVPDFNIRADQKAWMLENYPLEALQQQFPDGIAVLSAADRAHFEAIRGPSHDPSAETLEDLLARVYDHPQDDGARLVLADWLSERGDPRGEILARQVTSTALTPAQSSLVKEHEAEWIGPIARVLLKKRVIHKGFLSEATVRFKQPEDVEELGDHPAWATLTSLDLAVNSRPHLPSTARALRHLGDANDDVILQLCAREFALPLTSLRVELHRRSAVERLVTTDTLPALRHLELRGPMGTPTASEWLWRTRFHARLETLAVTGNPADWVSIVNPRRHLRTLIVKTQRIFEPIRLERGPSGALSLLYVTNRHVRARDAQLLELVATLDLTEVHTSPKSWTPPTLSLRQPKPPQPAPPQSRLGLVTCVAWGGDTLAYVSGTDLVLGDEWLWTDQMATALALEPSGASTLATWGGWNSEGALVSLSQDGSRTTLRARGGHLLDLHPRSGVLLGEEKQIVWLQGDVETAFRSTEPKKCLRWSPSGKRFAMLDNKGVVRVWEPPNPRRVSMLKGPWGRAGLVWMDEERLLVGTRTGLAVIHPTDKTRQTLHERPDLGTPATIVGAGGRFAVEAFGKITGLDAHLDPVYAIDIPPEDRRGKVCIALSERGRLAVGLVGRVRVYSPEGELEHELSG